MLKKLILLLFSF